MANVGCAEASGSHFGQQIHAADEPTAAPVLFSERLEPEQDPYVHEDKQCNTDIVPDGGLETKQSESEADLGILLAVHIHDPT